MAVYLDNAATTKPSQAVIDAVTHCMQEVYGNPSSLHRMGLDAQLLMDDARKTIASAIGCDAGCILFTSGATESSNLALRGAAAVYGKRRPHIVTSAVEHASVTATMDALEAQGFQITRIRPAEDGQFHAEEFINAVTDQTCLVSCMLTENETGRILPVQKIFRVLKKRFPDLITHCDAVQAFMKMPIKVNDLHADLISMSAHKIHGPKGIGALYIRKGIRLHSIVTGGKQERSIRPGTEAMPLIAGFGAAVKEMQPTITQRYAHAEMLRDFFLGKIADMPEIHVNSTVQGSPYIISIAVEGIRSEIMLHFLERKEIYVSSGSACSKGTKSGVLTQYRILDDLADSTLRISFSEETTQQDILTLLDGIRQGMAQLVHK